MADLWTEQRREILSWLQRNASSLGELYEGSIKILFENDHFPGKFRFVAHAVREIINRLPDIIAGTRMERLDYVSRLDSLESLWNKFEFRLSDGLLVGSFDTKQEKSDRVEISIRLFMGIESLIKDHQKTREKPKDKTKRLFEAIAPQHEQLPASLIPVIKQWVDLSKWFVGVTHESCSEGGHIIDSDEFANKFKLFERTLWALLSNFYKSIEGLDEILEDTNS